MGVGTPSDIVGAVRRGIDMFDCVLRRGRAAPVKPLLVAAPSTSEMPGTPKIPGS